MSLTKLNNASLSSVTSAGLPAGTVLQVQSFDKLDDQIIIGTSFTDVMSVSITPTSTTSKILVKCDINISASTASEGATGSRYSAVKLYRDSTQIGLNTSILSSQSQVWFSSNSVEGNNSGYGQSNSSGSFMDSPSTTSAITYKIQAGNTHAASSYTYINRTPKNNDASLIHRGISNITVMEIAG
jgi:hypothetical protein